MNVIHTMVSLIICRKGSCFFLFIASFAMCNSSHSFLHKQHNDLHIIEYPPPHYLSYKGQYWKTPKKLFVHTVLNATMLPNGFVYNKTYNASVNKWYWSNQPIVDTTHVWSNREYISFIQIWQDYFQHIVFDTLPKASSVCDLLLNDWRHKYILIKSSLQGKLIRYICPSLRQNVNRFCIIKHVMSAKSISVIYFDGVFQMGIVPFNSIPNIATGNNRSYVIYMPRKHGQPRCVTNERFVLDVLRQKFGSRLHIFHSTNYKKDMLLFNNAKVIIGPHGGALSNMIFAPVGTTIIEFLPLTIYKVKQKNERPCYFGLANGMGFPYYSVEPDTFNFDTCMQISIRKLQNVLSLI